MLCRALLLAANHLSLHPFQHHKRTGKAGLMGQAQMSLQMVLRHETGGFTGKFQVRRTAWLALTTSELDAATAQRWGLVDSLVDGPGD